MRIATDPMHQFKVSKLLDLNVGGYDISFTNSALFMVIGVLLVIGFLAFATSKMGTIPNRVQSLAEIWYSFIAGIVKDVNHAPVALAEADPLVASEGATVPRSRCSSRE